MRNKSDVLIPVLCCYVVQDALCCICCLRTPISIAKLHVNLELEVGLLGTR